MTVVVIMSTVMLMMTVISSVMAFFNWTQKEHKQHRYSRVIVVAENTRKQKVVAAAIDSLL